MKKKLMTLAAALISAALLFTACTTQPANDPPAAAETPAVTPEIPVEIPTETPQPEQPGTTELMIYRQATVGRTTANPHMFTAMRVMPFKGSMVATLSSVDGSNQIRFVPHHLAELPDSEDGLVWTLHFREGMFWPHDRSPLNANTYYYSMKMLIDPLLVNSNAAFLFDPCVVVNAREYFLGEADWEDVGIRLIDDYTLEITLEFPVTPLDFWSTIGTTIWPVHEGMYEALMNEERTITTYGTSLETTPSAGEFILTEWVVGGYELWLINPYDPLVQMGYFALDGWHERAIASQAVRSEMFWAEELDQHSLTGEEYLIFRNDPRARRHLAPNVWGFFVNGASETNPILRDRDFRQALNLSAPRVAIAREVYVVFDPANYIISTAIMVGDPLTSAEYFRDTPMAIATVEAFSDNIELAIELFDRAFEANGGERVSIEIIHFDGQEDMTRLAEVTQERWETTFGRDRLEVTLRAVLPMAAYDNYRAGTYDIGIGVRLVNIFNPWSSMNVWTQDFVDPYITGFASDEFDELYFETMFGRYVHDPVGRAEALARMEYMLMDFAGFIPLMQNNNTVIFHERIFLPTDTFLPSIGFAPRQSTIIP